MSHMQPHQALGLNLDGREFVVQQELNGVSNCWEVVRGQREYVESAADRCDVIEHARDVLRGRAHFVRFPQRDGRSLTAEPRAVILDAMTSVNIAVLDLRRSTPSRRPRQAGGALDWLAWFSPGETGESLSCAAADLRRHVREMRDNGCGRMHVLAVRFWITCDTIVPVVWDCFVRVAKQLPLLGSMIRAIGAWLRRIDPPSLG